MQILLFIQASASVHENRILMSSHANASLMFLLIFVFWWHFYLWGLIRAFEDRK